MRIVGSKTFGQNILYTRHFQHGAHRSAGDQPGPLRCRLQQDPPGAVMPHDTIGDGPIDHRHPGHRLLGLLHPLADRLGNFMGFPQAGTDRAPSITDHHYGTEPKPPSALDDLGCSVDRNHPVQKFQFFHHLRFLQSPFSLVCPTAGQNFSPASLAPSARAFTLP